jgi:hypothetical protein
MTTGNRPNWKRWWYVTGSLLVLGLFALLAYGPSLNTVTMNLRLWKFSSTQTETPEREGRIRITRTICLGPVTFRAISFDSALARAERAALP